MRLIFVADEIPAQLRRIVEFRNEQLDPAEVLAVELRQFVGVGIRTIVPRVIGQTAEAQSRKGIIPSITWDENLLLAALQERHGGSIAQTAERIIDWARHRGLDLSWGRGGRSGSVFPVLDMEEHASSKCIRRVLGRTDNYQATNKARF